jgi:hypothetical protein
MRKRLMAAAAIAPLMLGYSAAHAQSLLTISSGTSTPVATATAVSSAPGDIDLNGNGGITLNNNAAPAITLNSDNNVSVEGAITSKNINNVTGILITGNSGAVGNTVSNSGTINLTEDYTPSDSVNTDGIAEAPFASPTSTGRIGIHLTGAFAGSIANDGVINIQGNNSTGILIENSLNSTLLTAGAVALETTSGGTITVTGNNDYGIRITGPGSTAGGAGSVTGNVLIQGAITVHGQNSVGFESDGPISGSLGIYSSITATGYAVETRETGTILTNIEKTPTDTQLGGSAVVIAGSVGAGVFLGAPPSTVQSTDTTTDADGDGIVDSAEGTSSLISYGSAPALQIGGQVPITLGNFSANTTTDNAYGLIIEGTVSGQGLLDGVNATAVNIAGVNGAAVNLSGGIKVTSTSTVSAVAYEADATAIHLGAGVSGVTLENDGAITASVTASGAHTATALVIDAGASLTNLTNNGTISANTSGDAASGAVIIDHSGTLSNVTNNGQITASLTAGGPGEAITGTGVALDLSANTTGINLTQQQGTAITAPVIVGDVLLGSGVNTVNLLNGSMYGKLSFGSAAGSDFEIENAALYSGALTYTGSGLAIHLDNGTLNDMSPTTINASELRVGSQSTLTVALDPAHGAATFFNVSGAATIAAGAKIGATVLSTPSLGGQTFTIIRSPQLSLGAIDSSLLGTLPYLFNGTLTSEATSLSISIQTKTPAQMNLNKAETSAFGAIYAALPQDSGIQTAVLGGTTRAAFVGTYDQLLPSSSGDVFQTAFGVSKAVSRATAERFDTSNENQDEDDDDFIVSGFWASEFYSSMDQTKVDNNGYHSAALGLIGGYDFGGTGVTIAAASSNIIRPGQIGDGLNAVSVVEAGFYASPRFGALSIDARLGAGWMYASDRREFVSSVVTGDLSSTSTISRTAKGSWNGLDLSAHLGAGLTFDVGKHLFFEPKAYADVFYLREGAYDEHGGGSGFDLNVASRSGTQTNGTISLVSGMHFGNQFVFTPQIELGYDKVVTGGPGDTTAQFAYGGPSFTVAPNQIDGAAMARLSLRGDGNYVHFSLQGGGEYSNNYRSLDLKAVFRLTF